MLQKEEMLKSLKGALKGEMDSVTLYEHAAENTNDSEIKSFFIERAAEEKKHYNFLLQYYKDIDRGETDLYDIVSDYEEHGEAKNPIFSDEFIRRIAASHILFSAISTAVLLEMNAITYYRKAAESTTIPNLKKFYQFMLEWESKHYDEVLKIQEEAEHFYWTENRFEPF